MEFVPLYVRSEYSMLQSTCSIDKLVNTAKQYGYNCLAVTDEGVMHGTIKFYKACKKAGISKRGNRTPSRIKLLLSFITIEEIIFSIFISKCILLLKIMLNVLSCGINLNNLVAA